jgi:hypothetical protein
MEDNANYKEVIVCNMLCLELGIRSAVMSAGEVALEWKSLLVATYI